MNKAESPCPQAAYSLLGESQTANKKATDTENVFIPLMKKMQSGLEAWRVCAILDGIVRGGLSEEVTFVQKLEGSKRVSHVGFWRKWSRQR